MPRIHGNADLVRQAIDSGNKFECYGLFRSSAAMSEAEGLAAASLKRYFKDRSEISTRENPATWSARGKNWRIGIGSGVWNFSAPTPDELRTKMAAKKEAKELRESIPVKASASARGARL